jgi:signal transduction histidine kinase
VTLTISDNGRGFALKNRSSGASHEQGRRGFGLTGMEERARALGGRLTMQTAPDRGTVVSLVIHSRSNEYV